MLNKIIVIGRLTKEPELRKSNSGKLLGNFNLAIDNRGLNPDGTRGTTFINCISFKENVDEQFKYLGKGKLVAVEGCLRERTFERKDGTKGHEYEIIIDSLTFLEPKKDKDEIDEMINEELQIAEAIEEFGDTDTPFKEEETKPQEKSDSEEQLPWKFDPVTGKPLKPKAKK